MTNDEEIEALKPCPFCGGEASVSSWGNHKYGGWNTGCKKCSIYTPPCCGSLEIQEQVWNTRAAMRPVNQEMLEALKAIKLKIERRNTSAYDQHTCDTYCLQIVQQAILSAESGQGE